MSQVRIYARHATVALVLSSAALMAQAALVTTSGLSTDSNPASPGAVGTKGTPSYAQAEFLKLVNPDSVRTENFEKFSAGQTFQGIPGAGTNQPVPAPPLGFEPTAGSQGTGTPDAGKLIPSPPLPAASSPAVQNPGLIVKTDPASYAGRFNTTGGFSSGAWASGKWWEATGDFTITFDAAISAFGFFLTDSNDFEGRLDLVLILEDGTEVSDPKTSGITGSPGTESGSLQFFGLVDDARKFKGVRFDITQKAGTAPSDYDVFGLDDLLIGTANASTPPVPVPEPASLALAALSLGALAATRRRRPGRA